MKSFLRDITWRDVLTVTAMFSLMMLTKTHNIAFLLVSLSISVLLINRAENVFPLYFMSSLSTSYFSLGGGQSAGRYLSIIVISSLICSTFSMGYQHKNAHFASVLLLIMCSFLSAATGYTGELEIFIQMLQIFIILFLLQSYVSIDLKRLLTYLAIGLSLVVMFVLSEAISNSAFVLEARYRGTEDGVNANRIGMMLEQCGALMMAVFFINKNKIIRILSILVFFSALFVIIATGSRASLLALLVSVPVCVFISATTQLKKALIPIIILSVLFVFVFDYLSTQDFAILDRFTLKSVEETGGTGRADNIKIIMTQIFPDHFLFGSGIGGGNMKALGLQYNLPNLAHNIIIDPLSQLGVVFYPIFLIVAYSFVRPAIGISRRYQLMIVPVALLFSAIVNGIGETIFFEKLFWNDIALCMLLYNKYTNDNSIV